VSTLATFPRDFFAEFMYATPATISAYMCPDQSRGNSVGIVTGHRVPLGGGGEVKLPGLEADHSPPTSAEVKKMWIYTPTPPYTEMAYCLIG
jgi:hypothetical protein